MLDKSIRQLLSVAAVMVVMDVGWLTATATNSRQVFAALQGQPLEIRWIPSVIVYVLMIAAVWFFAVQPATSWFDAAGRGAFLGLATYGVYDMTNLATLKKYPVSFAVQDMIWGTILFGLSATVAALF